VNALIEAEGPAAKVPADNLELMKALAMLEEVSIEQKLAAVPPTAAAVGTGGVKLYVLDVIDIETERARLKKQVETLQRGIGGIEAKLCNKNFLAKAPPEVVAGEKDRLTRLKSDLTALTKSLEALD
jgi:valyl-tRNA synthetase